MEIKIEKVSDHLWIIVSLIQTNFGTAPAMNFIADFKSKDEAIAFRMGVIAGEGR